MSSGGSIRSLEHLVPGAASASSQYLQAPTAHHGPVLNHAVEYGSTDHSVIIRGLQRSARVATAVLPKAAAPSNLHRRPTPRRLPRVPSSEAFGRRPPTRLDPHAGPASETPVWTAPASQRTCCSWGRVWSIAIMCPALVCGHVDRGPRWVTRIGSQTSRRGLRPKGFPGVFRSSVRPIAILLLSLQAPGQNAVSELF